MRDQQGDDLFIGKLMLAELQLAILRFVCAQQLARRDLHLGDQFAQLRFAQRLDDVVDFLVLNAALTEQPVGLAAGASSRLFVDDDHRSLSVVSGQLSVVLLSSVAFHILSFRLAQ